MILCALTLLLQIVPLRFAWLTDLHVGSEEGTAALQQVVAHLNQRDDIRFVLVSGDITEMGATEELEAARRILDTLRQPFHIIPGNHDTKWSASGGTLFPKLFGSDRFVVSYGGYAFIGFPQGPLMRMADGHLTPEDLRWVDSTLGQLRDTGRPAILVCHYPMDSSVSNWYELLDRLDNMDVRLFLVGHGHRNLVMSFEGFPGIMSRSILPDREGKVGYTTVTLIGDSLVLQEEHTVGRQLSPWHSFRLAPVRHRIDSTQRPGHAVNAEYPSVRKAWRRNVGQTIVAGPALIGDTLVVGDASGVVHAFRASTGEDLWTFRVTGPVVATPGIAAGHVVVSSTDSSVYCLDLTSGRLVWRYTEGAAVVAVPAVSGSVVYVGGSDNRFRALDVSTGSLLWSFDDVEGFVESRPLIHNGLVIFGAWDEHLYALDATTGELRWRWRGPRRGRLLSSAACWPVAVRNKVFIVAPDRAMTALDVSSGEVIWRTTDFKVRESLGLTSDSAFVIVRTMNDSLVALDSRADLPRPIWISTPGFGYDINAAMPAEMGGCVFYGSMKGILYALDASDGRLRWMHRVGNVPVNTLVPLDENTVIATDFDGNISLVRNGAL